MKYETKQKRLVAIFEGYRRATNKTLVTTQEVAEWAMSQELWPVPRRGDPDPICENWELRLNQAIMAAPAASERRSPC